MKWGKGAPGLMAVLWITSFLLGGALQIMYNLYGGNPLIRGSQYVDAVLVANKSGVYVLVNVHFDEPVWVKGIAISNNLWPVMGTVDVSAVLHEYMIIPVGKAYGAGDWRIVVPVDFGKSEIVLPVWNGSVVFGENLCPLDEFGKVSMLTKLEREVKGRYEVSIVYAYQENPVILSTRINESQLQETVQMLAERNASIDELAQTAKNIAEVYTEALLNGSVIIGYERCDIVGVSFECYKKPIPPNVTKELVGHGEIAVRVKVVTSIVDTLGVVEAHNITYMLKRHSVKIVTYDASEGRVVNVYKNQEEALHSPLGVPTAEKYAVVVLWAKTPYSPLHGYATMIENPFLRPDSYTS